ncbi:MAG: class I SAM-dependent methyltransferase [Candidatus Accumulibacter sp.]|jgi:SAM-dependent methyltransferase|nr:class I SAM-dependent methyltransferase [Accumulibacter sp.]
METENLICPVCFGECSLFDVVDFNKSCQEINGKYFHLSGVPIYYARCAACGFCFAPEFSTLSPEEFRAWIYNDEYILVDPGYVEARPRENAAGLLSLFPHLPPSVKHLDYGSGNGLLANLLRESNWNSVSYDPLLDKDVSVERLGKYDLITAIEVFEHVPDVQKLMSDLRLLLSPDGLVLFSTLLSDGNIHANQRLAWWYASPRNGHISLFSKKSLEILAKGQTPNARWNFTSFSEDAHAFYTSVPSWAKYIKRPDAAVT